MELRAALEALLAEAETISERCEQLSEEHAAPMVAEAQQLLQRLHALDYEGTGDNTQRALGECVRGTLLDLAPLYCADAELALTRAVKLNPSLVQAWNTLGHCYWKKGDLKAAKHCFDGALKRVKNKTSLQQLSMLQRSIARGNPAEAAQRVDESVRHAKAALSLDLTDPRSWYCMGNASLAMYFHAGACDPKHLRSALKAYQNAEKDSASQLPDLHFNRATVYRYLEEPQRALQGFAEAARLDPSLPCAHETDAIVAVASKLHELVAAKGHLKPKRLQTLVSSVSTADAPARLRTVGVAQLAAGGNTGVCVPCRVAQAISHPTAAPLHYVMVDHTGTFFALSVLGLGAGAIKSTASLCVMEPNLKPISCSWNGKTMGYLCVQLEGPRNLLVGGLLPMGFQAAPTLQTHFAS